MVVLLHNGSRESDDNVALDGIAFQEVETGGNYESLRCWESSRPAVILGALGSISRQVDEKACREDDVPILRRLSGGGAVVIGPGCLNYSLVLSMDLRPGLRSIEHSYEFILGRMIRALRLPGLAVRGTSDLALEERKVSGNSQRRGRRALLHHGTILYDFDILLMERYLKHPPRQPAYRSGRTHRTFVANAPVARSVIEQAITKEWVSPDQVRRGS